MNIWDILILAAVAIAVFFALRKVWKNKRSGGCGCGCEGCTKSAGCQTKK
ncbi:MAG: FeoB-associated Cys-rich membrane protein [Clostridia bacterium]|nr:FeoB-associated Cys-rich membrane protein [Clostridia bacterium]MBQ6233772.1 FeoB-associated Cys-rich membrane protein [Clostridia bacterium]